MSEYPLGRRESFDARSRNFPIRALLGARPPRSYTWSCEPRLDQGQEGTCVGFAWAHELAARPTVWPANTYQGRLIYRESCAIDEWAANDVGPDYSFGTSVLAGAKTIQSLGHAVSYHWAFGLDDLILGLGYKGPAVLGIPWLADMFDPDANGLLHVSGAVAGGHAILANGVNLSKGLIRLHNSWGPNWGLNGEAFITFADLNRLLHEGGEACIPVGRTGT